MPVIVVGADTDWGAAIIELLVSPGREVRAFVSDPAVGAALKVQGVKTAVGDVSDASHVAGACMRCFSAVLVGAAAVDSRERAFASDERSVLRGWGEAASQAGVRRVIWVLDGPVPAISVPEMAQVPYSGVGVDSVARRVAALDDAARL